MQLIENITSSANQITTLVLDNHETVDFKLRYNGRMEMWYFSFEYNDIIANNLKVCLHPNILRQFRNIIPFGIAFASDSIVEPFQLTSFSEGAVKMYLLNKDEVEQIENDFFGYQETSTYKYIGDYNTLETLQEYIGNLNKDDYAFVVTNNLYARYVYNGTNWIRA